MAAGAAADPETRTFGFLLLPKFSLLAFTSAVEPLRSANRLTGRPLYDWRLISGGGPVAASGGTAAMDLMLGLIAVDHGRELATAVAEPFLHARIRDPSEPQCMDLRTRLGITHPKLPEVIEIMEGDLEEPLTRGALAARTGISTRPLERLFRRYLQRTPTRYYLELRLHRARGRLTQTALSVLDVALACGFVSASHFSKCYRESFHKTPREERAPPR